MLENDIYYKTYTEASKSDQGVVLVDSEKKVFKLDDYIRDKYNGVSGIDAIYDDKRNNVCNRYFIEFKSGDNYTISDIMKQILCSLIIYFRDEEECNISMNKYCFYLVIKNDRYRVKNGVRGISVKSEISMNKNRYESFQMLFDKLKKMYFFDARFKRSEDLKTELCL